MGTTYSVTKTDRGDYALTVSHSDGFTFTRPTVLSRHKTRKAACVVGRLLAGRSAHFVEFK
jgi:hypothetical protein